VPSASEVTTVWRYRNLNKVIKKFFTARRYASAR